MSVITNIAAYKFAHLENLRPLREDLTAKCKAWGLKGTILLSPEGINLFVAGIAESIEQLLTELRSLPGLADLTPKVSESATQPFRRMLVRLKKEIISFGVEGIDPARRTSPKLAAKQLKQWLDEGRPLTLLDTRNDYEVKLGTFENAMVLDIDHFREFPAAVAQMPEEMKEQPIVMFCTGGIRCEKAGPFMEREGFKNIFQLDGGILKYFEECGSAHYQGECFVFDQRVGLDPHLDETDSAMCFACQSPLTKEDQASPHYVRGESCPYCWKAPVADTAAVLAERAEAIKRVTTPLPGSVPYDNYRPLRITEAYDGLPLIEALCGMFSHISREHWETVCASGRMLNDYKRALSASETVRAGAKLIQLVPGTVEPEVNTDIRILHEDEAVIVLYKPAPLPIHPSGRFNRNTLKYLLAQVYHPQRPQPAHRLDANTAGLVVATRNRHFASLVQTQFANGEVEKTYLVRVIGSPSEDSFTCTAAIGSEPGIAGSRKVDEEEGKAAHTDFKVLRRLADNTTILEANPLTGRTHQIRIHLWQTGLPVCGDPVYLPDKQMGKLQTLSVEEAPLCLYAWRLSFNHPVTGQRVNCEAPLPDWMEK
jgi:RluA family pseudouridine synthase